MNTPDRLLFRISFDTLVDVLTAALQREGFVVREVADFQRDLLDRLNLHFRKYKVLAAHLPQVTHHMLSVTAPPGIVVPWQISVIEKYPGTVEVIIVNTTALLIDGVDSPLLHNLAAEVDGRMKAVLRSLEHDFSSIPDLITSWG